MEDKKGQFQPSRCDASESSVNNVGVKDVCFNGEPKERFACTLRYVRNGLVHSGTDMT